MKNTFIVVTICENEKYYSYIVKHKNNNNLLSTLRIKNIVSAMVFDTLKKAREAVNRWNATYYANGTNLFDPIFKSEV